ncbi:MAG: amino acid--tRNA ligase-related protein [Minisyncoccota bacterium]
MNNLGLYSALSDDGKKRIKYNGNSVFQPIENVKESDFNEEITTGRIAKIFQDPEYFYHLHKIDNGIFFGAVEYFRSIGAEWCNLPLTTLMISSPGEVYAGKTLDYTTDTLPVDISWFDNERNIFLSESSQFYLELRLLTQNIDKVFSIYNSFRKEKADFCHLSEFQHIEFEGKVSFDQNIDIFLGLVRYITKYLTDNERKSLRYFIGDAKVEELTEAFSEGNIITITFKDALEALHKETGDDMYKEFSLKNFGAWEEIKLTEIFGKHVIVTKFPLLQIPFYHNELEGDEGGVPLAENADFILCGYRETVGSGSRISSPEALREKAKAFNLPTGDYDPYIQTRLQEDYQKTSGFGLGWQRYVQWVLQLPYIWEATHIPRGHHLPKP